jgi:hypothetical protein
MIARTFSRIALQAVYRFGKQARRCGLTGATRAGKKVGMPDAVAADGVLQGVNDMILAEYLFPEMRPVLTIKSLRHGFFALP